MYFANIAALLAQPFPISSTTEFNVGGFYDRGDGGGGTFIWVPTPGGLDEDLGIIFYSPNDSGGYFQRIFSGPINVRWFGAIYDATLRPDVTTYVHAARDSQAFANNGTLYFPKGLYPGAFKFMYINDDQNEINLLGDGQSTILKSNGLADHHGASYPVLTIGWKKPTWRWAKIANLQIDGAGKHSNGVVYANTGGASYLTAAGRWIFEQVLFVGCDKAVFKPAGNIGNHYIDCSWWNNNYGIYARGGLVSSIGMHAGCDRYTGGHFDAHTTAAIFYEDFIGGNGQIILDGTVIEYNAGFGIHIKYTAGARMATCAVSIRNVWFEKNTRGDMKFEGVRSVRIDDCYVYSLTLIASSVNLYNCYAGGDVQVDDKSSLVAYEHRYLLQPSNKIFVNSISYDATSEMGNWQAGFTPAPWEPSSVWGPLRAVTSKLLNHVVISDHLESGISWFDWGTTTPYTTSIPSSPGY